MGVNSLLNQIDLPQYCAIMSGRKRIVEKISHSGLFSGVSIIFCGLPASRVRIFSDIVTSHGGSVLRSSKKNKVNTVFKSADDVNVDMSASHIVVGNRITMQELIEKMQCDCIPDSVEVVLCTWIEQSVLQKKPLDAADYRAIITPTVDTDDNHVMDVKDDSATSQENNPNTTPDYNNPHPEPSSEKIGNNSQVRSHQSGSSADAAKAECHAGQCAGIILKHQHSIFMVQPTGSSGWGIPKGGVEVGETLEDAARREFLEETGISLKICRGCQNEGNTRAVNGVVGMNSKCDCAIDDCEPIVLTYLSGSGGGIKRGKKIHAFVCNGHGEEVYISSNLIDKGFRKGLPENSGGRYVSVEEALNGGPSGSGVVHKNQRKLIELYADTYTH